MPKDASLEARYGRFSGGERATVLLAVLCCLVGAVSARAEVKSGTYTGNGAASRQITNLGFRPEVVIIKGNNAQSAVIRTSTLPAGMSKQLAQDQPLLANRIRNFTATGFEIGADADVNASGVEYAWVAFSAAPARSSWGPTPATAISRGV